MHTRMDKKGFPTTEMVAAVSKSQSLPIGRVNRRIMNKRPGDADWRFKCRRHHCRLDFTISISTCTKWFKTIKKCVFLCI